MLSEQAVATLAALPYQSDSDWGINYLPFGSIYWHDEFPDSVLTDLFDCQEDLSLINAMFGFRLKVWDGQKFSAEDQQLWDVVQRQVPHWAFFHRLTLTEEQERARGKAERQVEQEFENFF